jgi:hypothetical protein
MMSRGQGRWEAGKAWMALLCLILVGLTAGTAMSAPPPAGPGAPPTPPDLRDELVRRAAESGLTPEQTQAILQRADQLETSGLPSWGILDRYLEGMAKQIPLPQIEAAVARLEDRLHRAAHSIDQVFPAGPAVAGKPSPAGEDESRRARAALIDHGAYALSVGLTPEMLMTAMRFAADEHQGLQEAAAPVLALSCLVNSGAQSSASLELVQVAWSHGLRGTDLEHLGRDLGSLGRDGQGPPPEVLQEVLGWIRAGTEHDRLFKDLDQLRGRGAEQPEHPPGMNPGDDPSHIRGPGGPPEDPSHDRPDGHHHPPPPPDGGGPHH